MLLWHFHFFVEQKGQLKKSGVENAIRAKMQGWKMQE